MTIDRSFRCSESTSLQKLKKEANPTTTSVDPSNGIAAIHDESVSIYRQAAVFLIIEVVLIFAPLIILGAAINWPASLDEPANVNLPLRDSRS
jgi:hypothetical protein